jgi:uncharacterized membrane protein YeaQ/YmgE (transglycosylase-associated protein family)
VAGRSSTYIEDMLWLIIGLILSGLIVGAIARLAVPGPDPMPWWMTILLGWAGSLVGGIVAWLLFGRGAGIVFSVLGAVLLLVLYRVLVEKRPLTGPGARR